MSLRADCARGDTTSSSCRPTRNAIRFLTTTMDSLSSAFRFAPPIPFVRNYFRNERLYARLSRHLAEVIKQREDRSHSRAARA